MTWYGTRAIRLHRLSGRDSFTSGGGHGRVSADTRDFRDAGVFLFQIWCLCLFAAKRTAAVWRCARAFGLSLPQSRRGRRENKEGPCIFVFVLHDDLDITVI